MQQRVKRLRGRPSLSTILMFSGAGLLLPIHLLVTSELKHWLRQLPARVPFISPEKFVSLSVVAGLGLLLMLSTVIPTLIYLLPAQGIALLRMGRCPCDGEDLAALDPEPDNCVICPICGGAWRLPRRYRRASLSAQEITP